MHPSNELSGHPSVPLVLLLKKTFKWQYVGFFPHLLAFLGHFLIDPEEVALLRSAEGSCCAGCSCPHKHTGWSLHTVL